jgi:NADPH:quinone reductase-like Zn-dependent oxidoreductase
MCARAFLLDQADPIWEASLRSLLQSRRTRSSNAEEAARLGITVSTTQVRSNGAQLAELGRLFDAGTLRVAIDSTFPLADASKAHARAADGHIQGKIVLVVS